MAGKLKVGDRVEILSVKGNFPDDTHTVGDIGVIEFDDKTQTPYLVRVGVKTQFYTRASIQLLHPQQGENG